MTDKKDTAGKMLGWSIGSGVDKKDLEDLIDLPCHYSFKVVGDATEHYQVELIQEVEKKLGRCIETSELTVRKSETGKYVSITLQLYVTTIVEIHDIYAILKAHKSTRTTL